MTNQYPKDLVPYFFGQTASTYDKIVLFTTFGKDNYWKNEIINKIKSPESILDLACGTGILTRKLAKKFPKSEIIGIDISQDYLKMAEKNSSTFSNISFLHQDAENLNLDLKFDCICSSYIPKYCNPEKLVKNCITHLNYNGQIILHDFSYPKNKIIKKLWNSYFVFLNSLGIFLPTWKYAFAELPKVIRSSNWVFSYKQELEKNDFQVKVQYLTWNSSVILYAEKPQSTK
ncbi:methylase [Nitrosopumilus sp. b1]|uniref:class I SAM-dependent methyltransferase n=1 Tax=Nitrosopumilus sp. b1 TaxID=2109907 RepID=UPI0015F36E41|nr:class I SAM-dependent methyltransferase [Nitrosopumilus sp. b1]KAF6243967.1 methylase [Nitrosopumilus sp. b1]